MQGSIREVKLHLKKDEDPLELRPWSGLLAVAPGSMPIVVFREENDLHVQPFTGRMPTSSEDGVAPLILPPSPEPMIVFQEGRRPLRAAPLSSVDRVELVYDRIKRKTILGWSLLAPGLAGAAGSAAAFVWAEKEAATVPDHVAPWAYVAPVLGTCVAGGLIISGTVLLIQSAFEPGATVKPAPASGALSGSSRGSRGSRSLK